MRTKREAATIALLALALLQPSCEDTTATAPNDGTMIVVATPTTIVIDNGAGETEGQTLIGAQVFDNSGFALKGIAVLFTATAGQLSSSDNSCVRNACRQSGAACSIDADCGPGVPQAIETDASGLAVDVLKVNLNTPSPVTITARSATLAETVAVEITTPTANVSPTAVIAATPSQQQVVDSPVTFDGLGSTDPDGPITCYQWKITSSLPANNETIQGRTASVVTKTYSQTQTLTVELRVSDDPDASTWCVQGTAADPSMFSPKTAFTTYKIVCDSSAPNANAGPDQTIFLVGGSATATLDGNASSDPDSPIASYSWRCGNGTAAQSGAIVTCTYTSAGVFTAELTVTNECGLSDNDTARITVSAIGK